MHTPVFFEEAIDALGIKAGGKYIDGTAGEGGHLQRMLELGGVVLGLDLDSNQIKNLETKINNPNCILVQGNFAEIEKIATERKFLPVEGVLLDLGLSMKQIKESGKGLSYKALEDNLDMRLDDSFEDTAADLLNRATEEELFDIFARYSEELNSKKIAKEIVLTRRFHKLEKVGDLIQVLYKTVSEDREKTYSRIFQALRIAVNHEFDNIKNGLAGAVNIISPNGKVVVISFHSLEDRIVKQFARSRGLKMKEIKIKDQAKKSFERSARLRVIEK